MLEAINLACERGERTLFHHLSFELREGEALLVQGANGSGKTSLLRMVCGLLAPVAGEIHWRGTPVQQERAAFHAETAYFGHMPAVKDELSALENLDFACRLGGRARARGELEEALARMGLAHCLDLPVKALSQGQRRRVALARLPLANAALWVLDEPLTALDQAAAQEVQALIGAHLHGGGMALLTTHQPLALAGCEPGVLALS